MGVNNKARRAAKRRRQRKAHGQAGHAGGFGYDFYDGIRDETEVARRLVALALLRIHQGGAVGEEAERLARASVAPQRIAVAMAQCLAELMAAVVEVCWTPVDLTEITRRRLSARHVPLVTRLVVAETERHPAASVAPAWREQIKGLELGPQLALTDQCDLEHALEVAALLDSLPPLAETVPPPGERRSMHAAGPVQAAGGNSSKALAKVRALLAKAESTEFPDEAEALSAKAQELVAAYSLDRLAHDVGADEPQSPTTARRLWIDQPYVVAKAMLASAVADANHCRAVLSEQLGFVTLVGHPDDVESCELLVTSLMVQAHRALLRQGRVGDAHGRSRTTSFRRSFLVSYATRIGERLRRTADDTLATSTRSAELVPVVARADEQARIATERLFPELTTRSATVSNGLGWAAGRAAADLALFDVHGAITEAAAS